MKKHILITGATSGIGKELALAYAQQKHTLILVGRNLDLLTEVANQCKIAGAQVTTIMADLAKMEEVEKATQIFKQQYNHLDILINNAGISQRSIAQETAEEVDRAIMEINFFSVVKLTKLLWPALVASAHANIVNISSVTGTFGFPQRTAYAASKHALEGFFESWMLENKLPHIYFTTIAPGRVNTNISYKALKNDGTAHQTMDAGQANGIPAQKCALKIIKAINQNKRKVYIVQQERILLFLHKHLPGAFIYLVKKLGLK